MVSKMFFTTVVLAVGVLVSCVLGRADTQDEEQTLGSMRIDGSGSNSNPPSLSLNLAIGGENLDLKLDLAPDLDLDIAVYVIDSNAEQFTLNRTTTQSNFNIYQDRERGAAFMLVTKTDDSGNTTHVLEGLVNKDGEVYHMHTEVSSNSLGSSSGPSNRRASSPIQLQFEKKKIHFSGAYDAGVRVEPPSLEELVTPGEATSRHKRQVTQDVYVDVVAMADYAVYSLWYSRSTQTTASAKRQDALDRIKQYYAFVFNSVDMIFQSLTTLSYAIRIRLVGIIIAENSNGSPMTENFKMVGFPQYTVDSDSAITSLKNWVKQQTVPSHDYFMLFTGYDLKNGSSTSTVGRFYRGTVCKTDGSETCLVEDTGTFDSIFTAATAVGSGLNAAQDGVGNLCTGSVNYVMAFSFNLSANVTNLWKFSTCSANYFDAYISNMAPALRVSCMYSKITASSDIPDVTSQMPGQVYNVTQQCHANYGSDFYFYQGNLLSTRGGFNFLCEYMPCWDSTARRFSYVLAAQGTTCGDKMWCFNSRCVYDSAAPSARNGCLFGDQQAKVYSNANDTCADIVSTDKSECYRDFVRNACCDSCAKAKRHVTDCEYGNSLTGCIAANCSGYTNASKQGCCETCNLGTPYTPLPAVDGQWGSWAIWSTCSVTCANGTQVRTRVCDSPAPQNGGYFCKTGSNTEVTVCMNQPCPINGQWGSWVSSSSCSVTCGGGQRNRTRVCDNPPPQHGGSNCTGTNNDTSTCNTNPCPIDGQWGLWGIWANCGVTCGNGTQTRTRSCNNPAPQNGGSSCDIGSGTDAIFCSTNRICPTGKASSVGGERTLIVVAIVAVGLLLHLDNLP